MKWSATLLITENKSLFDLKNEGTCFDDGGTDKFYCDCVISFDGERCERLAACDGNLCHNGGTCTTTSQADSQLGLIIFRRTVLNKIMMKPDKIFECSCADGFTGDFCEFKTEQDHLLFVGGYWNNFELEKLDLVLNADGRLIAENAVIDEQVEVYASCSTMLNGEAIIFGGFNFKRQVDLK